MKRKVGFEISGQLLLFGTPCPKQSQFKHTFGNVSAVVNK